MTILEFDIKPSGGDYTSLSAALAAEATNLVTDGDSHVFNLYKFSGGHDTNSAFVGYTTGASNTITITSPESDRWDGIDPESGFYFKNTGSVTLRPISTCNHIIVEYVCFSGGSNFSIANGGDFVSLENIGIKDASGSAIPLNFSADLDNILIINPDTDGVFTAGKCNKATVVNAGNRGIISLPDSVVTNCFCYGSTGVDFSDQGGTHSNNASEDSTALGSNSLTSRTSADFADSANDDFRTDSASALATGGSSDYIGYALEESGQSSINVTFDTTRHDPHVIVHQAAGSAPTLKVNDVETTLYDPDTEAFAADKYYATKIKEDGTEWLITAPTGTTVTASDTWGITLTEDTATLVTLLFDGKVIIKDIATDLVDGKVVISDEDTDLLDGKVIVESSDTDLLDGKTVIKDDDIDQLDGKTIIKDTITEILDGKGIIKSSLETNFDGKAKIKDSIAILLDGRVSILSKAINLLDGKVIIETVTNVTNLFDGKVIIESVGTDFDFLDGKVVIKDSISKLLDGVVVVQNKTTDSLDGIVIIKTDSQLNLDGKVTVKDVAINLLDGKARIKTDVVNVLDGKASITTASIGLLDGKVTVKDESICLFDGKVVIDTGETVNVFDGKVIISQDINGKVTVTFSAKVPGISFSSKTPSITFNGR